MVYVMVPNGFVCLVSFFAAAFILPGCFDFSSSRDDEVPNETTGLDDLTIPERQGPTPTDEMVLLGQLLFFEPELSGNRDIACATCHFPSLGGADAIALPIGTGGQGIGPDRSLSAGEFIPRHSPDLFGRNLDNWSTMFWDGRVSGSAASGFVTPLGSDLPDGLDNVLAAQALFPLLSHEEMRGRAGDIDVLGHTNDLALIADGDPAAVWDTIMVRILAIDEYRGRFQLAFPNVASDELTIVHLANAMAAFEDRVWGRTDTAFDDFLGGDNRALSVQEMRGVELFFGEAGCSGCHNGPLLSDEGFYNIGVPIVALAGVDAGRWEVTGQANDRYAFRTPPLRNVTLTGPWFHNGTFTDLRDVIRHHLDPVTSLVSYNPNQLPEALRGFVRDDASTQQLLIDNLSPELRVIELTNMQVDDLLAFLASLSSRTELDIEPDSGVPRDEQGEVRPRMPSGLPTPVVE